MILVWLGYVEKLSFSQLLHAGRCNFQLYYKGPWCIFYLICRRLNFNNLLTNWTPEIKKNTFWVFLRHVFYGDLEKKYVVPPERHRVQNSLSRKYNIYKKFRIRKRTWVSMTCWHTPVVWTWGNYHSFSASYSSEKNGGGNKMGTLLMDLHLSNLFS